MQLLSQQLLIGRPQPHAEYPSEVGSPRLVIIRSAHKLRVGNRPDVFNVRLGVEMGKAHDPQADHRGSPDASNSTGWPRRADSIAARAICTAARPSSALTGGSVPRVSASWNARSCVAYGLSCSGLLGSCTSWFDPSPPRRCISKAAGAGPGNSINPAAPAISKRV